jgi:hypothetical protein
VAYYSKSLQPIEHNYEIHNKELLAIIHALHHFHHYLQGSQHMMKIFSDHVNLKYFTTKQTLTHCQAHWALFLATFPYEIISKPGSTNNADTLSRCPDYKEGIATDNAERVLLTPDKFHIQALQTTVRPLAMDTELKAAIQAVIKDNHLLGPLPRTSHLSLWYSRTQMALSSRNSSELGPSLFLVPRQPSRSGSTMYPIPISAYCA